MHTLQVEMKRGGKMALPVDGQIRDATGGDGQPWDEIDVQIYWPRKKGKLYQVSESLIADVGQVKQDYCAAEEARINDPY